MAKRSPYYVLKGRTAVPASMIEWARFFEDFGNRNVSFDEIGGITISTIFLGLDHNHFGGGEPLLFETMIFDESGEGNYQTRCSTWDEAKAMHDRAVALVKDGAKVGLELIEAIRKP